MYFVQLRIAPQNPKTPFKYKLIEMNNDERQTIQEQAMEDEHLDAEEAEEEKEDPLKKDPEFYITAVHNQYPEEFKFPEPPQLPPENQLNIAIKTGMENKNPNQVNNHPTNYSEEEIENFRCIFEMFDKEKNGFIESKDLATIMKSLGREPEDAVHLLQKLGLDNHTNIDFEQFLRIMRELENKMVADKQAEEENEPKEATQAERNKYGVLLA